MYYYGLFSVLQFEYVDSIGLNKRLIFKNSFQGIKSVVAVLAQKIHLRVLGNFAYIRP